MSTPLPARPPLRRPSAAATLRLGFACLFVAGSVRAAAPAALPAGQVLTVSAANDNFPYSYRDESDGLTGYGVDMLDAVAEVLHARLDRSEVPATQDIANLRAGLHDIGQFHAINPSVEAPCEYSQPILINYGDFFVRRGDHRFSSLEDLRQQRARIAAHQQGRDFLLANQFDEAFILHATSTEAMRALSQGHVDAVLISRLSGLSQAHAQGISNVEPLGLVLPGFKVAFSIATRKGDLELLGRINEALATLSTTGRTVEIYTKWFGRYESRGPTLRQVLIPATSALALALLVTLWALRRQQLLHRRIALQSEELRESRELLAEAQHFSQIGHSRRPLDPQGPAIWSDELYRVFEYDPAGGVPNLQNLIERGIPADRTRWRAALEQIQRVGTPYEFDLTIEPRPGHRKIVNVRGRPIRDSAGRQTGIFGTAQDVSASRAAAAALQQSELLLRALYENLPLALGVVEQAGDDWQIVSLNPEAVQQLGLAAAPAANTPLADLHLSPERTEFWRAQFESCAAAGKTLRRETERSATRQLFAITLVPLVAPGRPLRCCFLSDDITVRRQQDAELTQGRRLRAIGELVGGIAHEFNNLLTPIALNTELVQSHCPERPDLQSELAVIADAARRAGELTRRLLTFGRKHEHSIEAIDLAQLAAANIALVRHSFDRRIVLQSVVAPSLPNLYLPLGDLHQILLNLLINARDALAGKLASPPPPDWTATITVSAELLGGSPSPPPAKPEAGTHGWLRLSVTDNGCGISPEVRERLFEPFFTTKGVGHGTGLGLATIWHLVTGFGGRIDVESTPGMGTSFHLVLPVQSPAPAAIPAATATAPAAPARPPATPLAGRHFLVADDDDSVSRIVTRLLTRKGHRITTASDGMDAWLRLSGTPGDFDGIIMDLNMPGLTGIELAHRARALPYQGPLIVISGKITEEERSALADIRIDALLHKPFSIAEFEAALARALSPAATPA
ncbi:MAG: transporter substrate-binding domain-containing protein [Opitutaceae bacterium]|nr:transporter substrate-binding domain-containing protein [Opitutaceae bacterium]